MKVIDCITRRFKEEIKLAQSLSGSKYNFSESEFDESLIPVEETCARSLLMLLTICKYNLESYISRIVVSINSLSAGVNPGPLLLFIKIWNVFFQFLVTTNPEPSLSKLGSSLTQIVMKLSAICDHIYRSPFKLKHDVDYNTLISAVAADTLKYLLIDNQTHVSIYFNDIPPIHDIPVLKSIRDFLMGSNSSMPLNNRIDVLIRQSNHASSVVRVMALQNLIDLIKANRTDFEKFVSNDNISVCFVIFFCYIKLRLPSFIHY